MRHCSNNKSSDFLRLILEAFVELILIITFKTPYQTKHQPQKRNYIYLLTYKLHAIATNSHSLGFLQQNGIERSLFTNVTILLRIKAHNINYLYCLF